MRNIHFGLSAKTTFLALIAVLFLLGGCFPTGSSDTTANTGHEQVATSTTVESEPYSPADFRDILIPGELVWSREKSVTINTNSFNGGILSFNGRVEVTSLMEFFTTSMKNNGWTAIGSITSRNVLLAFTKENSSCMIRITEGGPIGKTEVSVYIAHAN